jgi:hypothetical protein
MQNAMTVMSAYISIQRPINSIWTFHRQANHLLGYPSRTLLSSFVSRPDIEPHLDSWRNTADHDDGLFKDIMDGDVWKTIDGPNQEAFFNAQTEGQEIRLGLTMSLDWYVYFSQQLANSYLILNFCRFGITKSVYAPKHSTGVFSFGVANLGPSLRYDFPFFFSILVF